MDLTLKKLHPCLGAEVGGINLADDLDEATIEALRAAWVEHGVLVFPDQRITDAEQIAFSRRFGELEIFPQADNRAVANPEIFNLTNVGEDDEILPVEHETMQFVSTTQNWHTDSCYREIPCNGAILHGVEVTTDSGDTLFADLRAAYDELDDATKAQIEDLSAYHSLYQSQAKMGYEIETGSGYGYHTKGAPLRPLVKIHPETGRKALFIGRHAYRIPGLDDNEAQVLLDELCDFACRPPRTYYHRWQSGDVVIWDNRCVLHRARPYDKSQPRSLRHVRVAGDPESELAATAQDERAAAFEPSASNR